MSDRKIEQMQSSRLLTKAHLLRCSDSLALAKPDARFSQGRSCSPLKPHREESDRASPVRFRNRGGSGEVVRKAVPPIEDRLSRVLAGALHPGPFSTAWGKLVAVTFLLMFLFNGCGRVKTDPAAEALLTELDQKGDLITAKKIVKIPIDPEDPAWTGARAVVLPLVSQASVPPRSPDFRKMDLSVRALANKKEIGLLLSWSDPTKDEGESATNLFRDAVAAGFPVNSADVPLPYIGMGNKGRPVTIWHWKASWQRDVDRGYEGVAERHEGMIPNIVPIPHRTAEEAGSPMARLQRKSPVENLMAEGFGTLTSVPSPELTGRGVWRNGRWSVVIRRPENFSFVPVTFAVWDGSSGERNGMKGLTRWRFLRLEGEAVPLARLKNLIIGPIPGADPKRGKQLLSDMGCVSCHNLPGSLAVNDVGPDLTHAGSIHRPEYLLESIKDPNAVIVPAPGYYHVENQPRSGVEGEAPSGLAGGGGDASPYDDPRTWTSTMPSFGDQIPEKDYNDIVEYLRSLQ